MRRLRQDLLAWVTLQKPQGTGEHVQEGPQCLISEELEPNLSYLGLATALAQRAALIN